MKITEKFSQVRIIEFVWNYDWPIVGKQLKFGVRANGSFADFKVKHYKETDTIRIFTISTPLLCLYVNL